MSRKFVWGVILIAGICLFVLSQVKLPALATAQAADSAPTATPRIFPTAIGIGNDFRTPVPTVPPPATATPVTGYSCPSEIAPFLCKLPPAQVWGKDIVRWCKTGGFDANCPNRATVIMAIESCGIKDACSQRDDNGNCVGAFGLFQLTQSSFPEYSVSELFNPETNGQAGVKYVENRMNAAGGNFLAAAAGYNGGPLALSWQLGSITRDEYVDKYGETKAQEVERMVVYAKMYYEALMGETHPYFDKFVTERCSPAAKIYGLPWPPKP